MKIINSDDVEVKPWKNGLGFTKQIALSDDDSAYWRISIADVVENGEFSLFPELHRVLTVIEGSGMDVLSEDKTFKADFEKPVSFRGDIPIRSLLRAGPIKDLNLIYDAHRLTADVTVIKNTDVHTVERALISAVYILNGEVSSGVNQSAATGELLLASEESIGLSLSTKARVLVIQVNAVAM